VRYLPILLLALLHGCAVQPPQRAGDEQSAARLERVLQTEARRGFTGQVLVARGEHVLLLRAAGTREPGGQEPVTIDGVIPLASVTKPFTASAVLALAADGRLSLDDPIGRHLPQLSPPWSEVPVADFLTHTAGLPAELVNRAWPGHPIFEPVGREEFLASLAQFPPDHPPGAGFNYSNVGYLVLGALIETVSGESWGSFLHGRLLAPAGIDQVGFLIPAWGAGRPVHGRVAGEDRGSYFDQPRLEDGLGWRIRAAGDLQATPAGVLAWWLSIRRDEWLPPAAMAEWTTPRVREPDGSEYGYGLNFRRSRAGRIIGHTGSDGVFTSDWSWLADHDLLIYVASADPRHPADELREALLRALFRR
jgi:CubicO group peptidase (beta-lactamase class C family)